MSSRDDLVRIDMVACQAWLGGRPLRLCGLDFQILALLVRRAGRVVTYEQIGLAVSGAVGEVSDQAIIASVGRIRRRLGDTRTERSYIRTVRRGYQFMPSMVAAVPDPLAAYRVTAAGGRMRLPCPHRDCPADLLAEAAAPVPLTRLRELAAWHELEHQAEGATP